MRNARVLVGLLIAATVLVDLVAVSLAGANRAAVGRPPGPATWLLFALPISQVSLLTIWAGFGGTSLPWRMMALILAIAAWSGLIAAVLDLGSPVTIASTWTVLLLAQTVAILIPLLIAQLKGVTLTAAADQEPGKQLNVGRRRL